MICIMFSAERMKDTCLREHNCKQIVNYGRVFLSREEEYIRNLYKNLAHDSVELKSVRLVARLWTSFAKYG